MRTSKKARAEREASTLDEKAKAVLAKRGGAVPLAALVGDLSEDLGWKRDRVVEGLMGMRSRKAIVITEKAPLSSLASFAAAPASAWFWAAAGATFVSLVLMLVTSGVGLYLRYSFGSVFILFLPGYALLEALYPKKELDELTRFALSIGMSLVLVPLVGLALNFTPLGIRLLPVSLALAGTTLALLVFALARKHRYYNLAKGVQ